jgi:predicted  nucleic acid-binding Zn-ribbon protein
MQAPWTEIGRLQSDIQDLKSQINNTVRPYELASLRSTMDSLEHSLREVSSEVVCLRAELQEVQQEIHRLKFPPD